MIIICITLVIFLSIIGLLLHRHIVKTTSGGSNMTIVLDTHLHIKDVINPQADILLNLSVKSLKGTGLEEFLSNTAGLKGGHLQYTINSIKAAVENKSDAFFEYPTKLSNGNKVQTMCYTEQGADGCLLIRYKRMDINENIISCGKCNDYILALAINDLSVGVYIKCVDHNGTVIFTNNVAKGYCECDDITKSDAWNQEEEAATDGKAIQTGKPTSYEKITYDQDGKPLSWYNISKVVQQTDHIGNYIITTIVDISEQKKREIEIETARFHLGLAIGAGDVSVWCYNIKDDLFTELYGNIYMSNNNSMGDLIKICHPDSVNIFMEAYDKLISMRSQSEEIVVNIWDPKTETYNYIKSVMTASKSSSGFVENIIGTQKDITQDHKQKVELEKAQKNLSLAMEAGGVSVWIYDIAQEMFFTLQGDTIAGEGLTMAQNLSIMHPDDGPVCTEIIRAMSAGEISTTSVIYRFKADDIKGGYRYYEARKIAVPEDGVIKYLTGTQKEITNEHFYQAELEQSNQKAKSVMEELQRINKYNKLILDNSNSGLVYLSPDSTVRWENVSLMKQSDNYRDLFKEGEPCHKTFKGLDAPCPDCIVQQTISTGKRESKEVIMKNGEIVNIMATPVYDKNQELEGVVLKLDDITEQRKSFNELQAAKERAERSDKFKSNFLANMSHEIRTPLNAIVGFSELIADVETEEEKDEYNRIIATNNELLLKLINDILDLSKMEAGFVNIKNDAFDIDDLYNELSITFSQRMPSGVEFICEKPGSKCIVNLDKTRLTQVITNFVNNAIKFTTEGSIKMGFEIKANNLNVYVSDTGIGIAKEKIGDVFERFEKLNDFAQGTGLGLSICKSIVEAQHGVIGVDSTEGKGSTFWAHIPCEIINDNLDADISTSCIDIATNNEVNIDKGSGYKKRILVVEDTDSNFTLLHSMLHKNYDLIRVYNGEEAVSEVKNNKYNIVLMDIKMPVMDGIEATKRIREFNTSIQIIALTASVFDSNRQVALKAGCNYFLTKPINKVKLTTLLAEIQ